MKRFLGFSSYLVYLFMAGTLLFSCTSVAFAQEEEDDDDYAGARMPVYLYLTATISDHVNLDISEDRLRRILPMVEKYRKTHPQSGISATIRFSGAASQALAQRNSQTHIVDFVLDYLRRGVIEVGYDGTDEPTYKNRPVVDLSKSKTPEERWLARSASAEKYLTEARDLSGAVQQGQTGGLKKMQEVFGEAAFIAGVSIGLPDLYTGITPELGADSEIVHQTRRYNTKAVVLGVTEANLTHTVNYRNWTMAFGNAMSPIPDAPPELFWLDGVLRSSESSGRDNLIFRAYNGAAAFSFVIRRLDRKKIRIIHVELGNDRAYLTKPFRADHVYPPLTYAYSHPDQPQLPPTARLAASDVDASFANEDGLLKWLVTDLLEEQSGIFRFVSSADLKKLTPPAWDFDVPVNALRSALGDLMKTWGGDNPLPPAYLAVRDRYLSLAETFQVMADALAEQSRTGKLPQTVRVAHVYGPALTLNDREAILGEVTAASVARAAAGIVGPLHDDSWKPVPANRIPARVAVDGINLNSAQFLRLMAEALVASTPETKLQAKPTNYFWGSEPLFLKTRNIQDVGAVWTYKPAPVLWPRRFAAVLNPPPGP